MSALSEQVAVSLLKPLAGSWWGHATGVIILLLMGLFIGIWIWAWRPRHERVFSRLSRMPMEDMKADNRVRAPETEENRS